MTAPRNWTRWGVRAMVLILVAAIAIGVAVDDTVHLTTRFGAESRNHMHEADAVRATIRGEAIPIVSTSVALALGFSVLSLSNFSIVA